MEDAARTGRSKRRYGNGVTMEQVLTLLAREEHLLELLLHRVRVASLLLAADRMRFLATAADEIHHVVDGLAAADAARAVAVARLAERAGLAGLEVTLEQLASLADAPSRVRLLSHRERLRRLVAEVDGAVARAGEQATLGLARVRAVIGARPVGSGGGSRGVRPGGAG